MIQEVDMKNEKNKFKFTLLDGVDIVDVMWTNEKLSFLCLVFSTA